jgi:hypothetical protein
VRYRRWQKRILKLIRLCISSLPRKRPAYFRLEYCSNFYDYKTRLTEREMITLLPDKIIAEYITESSAPGQKERKEISRQRTEFPVIQKDFESFYRFLRKYRFDLIPKPYVHNSYDKISYEWSSAIFLKFGKSDAEENCKILETGNSMHMGIDGKDLKRFDLVIYRLQKLQKKVGLT